MNKYLTLVFFLFCIVTSGVSQKTLADYKYVSVPEQFDFVKGKDRYQVNSLSRFLFKKYGFDAYFSSELPDVTRCEVIWADVEGSSGLIYTKIRVVLRDCNGMELYRSQEGRSKDKDYKKAYHEAIREAFSSFESINKEDVHVPKVETTTKPAVTVTETMDTPMEKPTLETKETPVEVAKSVVYRYADYKIVPGAAGGKLTVYQNDEKIGSLTPASEKGTFLAITSQFNGIAYMNKRTIIIEYEVEGVQELVAMKFVRNEE